MALTVTVFVNGIAVPLTLDEEALAAISVAVGGKNSLAAEPAWLTYEQAAARLGCTPDAIRMRAKRGRLELRHHGRRAYVSRSSVDTLCGNAHNRYRDVAAVERL